MITNMRAEETVFASYGGGKFLHLKFMGAEGFLVLITVHTITRKVFLYFFLLAFADNGAVGITIDTCC